MSFEKFLQFWTVYNRQIIEFVFVSTFVLILYLIYRQFFSKSEHLAEGHQAHMTSIDTSEIEEKLKKILENQGGFRVPATVAGAKPSGDVVAAPTADVSAEIEKLKLELREKEKAIDDLKKATAAASVPTGSKEDLKKWEEKVKELEGRLQEYEIISEDIADLSFYKEENTRLQKELTTKGPGSSPASETVAPPVMAAVPTPAPAPVVLAEAVKAEAPTAIATAIEAVQKEAVAPAAVNDKTIDDDILKEFAAAVEGQKMTEPVSAQELDPQKVTESKDLMGEFENFIKKG